MNLYPPKGQAVEDRQRLEALADTGLLESLPEESFDRYTRVAKTYLRADVSLLSLVDADRQFFKSQVGLPSPYDKLRQTPLTHSFCKLVIETGQPLVVEDATNDERVKNNLAVRDLGVISYFGMPVRSEDGHLLGSLCVINVQPREWSDQDRQFLADLTAMVSGEIWMLQRTAALTEAVRLLEEAENDRERAGRMLVHDLRTPTTAILSSVELVESTSPPPTGEQTEYLMLIKESAVALDSMICDLVREGREAVIPVVKMPVAALIRRSASMIRPVLEQGGLKLVVSTPDGCELAGNTVRAIERVLLNLLTNAAKYSPKGSEIRLSATREVIGGRDGVRFEVQDSGPGVPEAEREVIFGESVVGSAHRFRGPESLGLGLAFCKSVAERMSGRVGVENKPGGGSTFYFSVPL
jgi:signal transduction histidine kinase